MNISNLSQIRKTKKNLAISDISIELNLEFQSIIDMIIELLSLE